MVAAYDGYNARVRESLGLDDLSPSADVREKAHAVAAVLGMSYTAAMKVVAGSGSFSVPNSAKFARKYGVDHHWLATGEGEPRPNRAWPFPLVDPEDYKLVSEQYCQRIENELAGEIQRAKGTPARSASDIRKILLDKERRAAVDRRSTAKRH